MYLVTGFQIHMGKQILTVMSHVIKRHVSTTPSGLGHCLEVKAIRWLGWSDVKFKMQCTWYSRYRFTATSHPWTMTYANRWPHSTVSTIMTIILSLLSANQSGHLMTLTSAVTQDHLEWSKSFCQHDFLYSGNRAKGHQPVAPGSVTSAHDKKPDALMWANTLFWAR